MIRCAEGGTVLTPVISLDEEIGEAAACATEQEPGCTQPVEWLAIERCCGKQILVCDYHKRRAEETTKKKLKIYKALFCHLCGAFPSKRDYIPV